MNILWIVNMVLPELADKLGVKTGSSGTWMFNLSKSVAQTENVSLAIACVYGKEYKKVEVNNITYYLIPGSSKSFMFYNKGLAKYWKMIEEDFHPEIVHIHGTEYTHSVSYIRNFPNKKYVLSIQGIISKIAKTQNADLTFGQLLRYRTFRENLHLNGMIEGRMLLAKNSKYEKEIISKMNFATGRTDWDKSFMMSLNPELRYYRCFYNLRDDFYEAEKWSIDKCNKHTIYASTSAQSPLKGGHIVLRALAIVKQRYPDVTAKFLVSKAVNGKLVVTNGYTKYIAKLVKKYHLEDNVEFVGRLNSSEVINVMQKAHICVIPSSCENASATLREAMHLGTPCVASFRGGMQDLIDHGESGFFYDFSDHELLALRICDIFDNEELAKKISVGAIDAAEKMHDKDKNTNDFINMYNDILFLSQKDR